MTGVDRQIEAYNGWWTRGAPAPSREERDAIVALPPSSTVED